MALEFIAYLCAPYIWVIHLHHPIFLTFTFVVLQLLLGFTADPPIPASDLDFWAWKTLVGLAGILAGTLTVYALRAPSLLDFRDRFDPVHVVWVIFQFALWHAILLFLELVVTPWGGFGAAVLFVILGSTCSLINRQRPRFISPMFADSVYFWLTFVLVLFTFTWALSTWLGLGDLISVGIALILWVPVFLYMVALLKPYYEGTYFATAPCGKADEFIIETSTK